MLCLLMNFKLLYKKLWGRKNVIFGKNQHFQQKISKLGKLIFAGPANEKQCFFDIVRKIMICKLFFFVLFLMVMQKCIFSGTRKRLSVCFLHASELPSGPMNLLFGIDFLQNFSIFRKMLFFGGVLQNISRHG